MERDVCDTESGFKESVLCNVFVCLQETMSTLDILTLITLYAEVVLFAYIEKKLWKTVYTDDSVCFRGCIYNVAEP